MDERNNTGRYKDLIAWRKAFELGLKIYKVTEKWPKHEQFGLTSQVRRAGVSVSANIAEGYEKGGARDYARYLSIARGSLGEVETLLLFALKLGYIAEKEYRELDELRKEVAKLVKGLHRSVSRTAGDN